MPTPTAKITQVGLPSWDEMSDIDKGAALRHAWKRSWEGPGYAVSDFPVEYVDHPDLVALDSKAACAHAAAVTKGLYGPFTMSGVHRHDWRIDEAEEERLTELHRTEGKRILDSRMRWAVRFENDEREREAQDTVWRLMQEVSFLESHCARLLNGSRPTWWRDFRRRWADSTAWLRDPVVGPEPLTERKDP